MKNKIILLTICFGAVIVTCCIDPFNPPSTKLDIRYLVVDGFLNATAGSCDIKLSRTIPIYKDSAVVVEKNATVQLLDNHNNSFLLTEITPGEYSISNLSLTEGYQYKLKIVTKGATEYQSDFVDIIKTPAIDSITWGYERTGVPIKVNTHDPENKTHYYSWSYTETWAYTSAFATNLYVDNDGKVKSTFEDTYHCYKSANSTSILISSSKSLNQDIISGFLINSILWTSSKLGIKYSIQVEQHGLSKGAYEYSELIKKNTENLGTLFDPLPTAISGNIHCVTNPTETTIGYFSACTVELKRIFIKSNQVRPHRPSSSRIITGYENCTSDSVLLGDSFNGNVPVNELYAGLVLIGYMVSNPFCVDCIYGGGTTTKPDFWEEN